MGESSSIPGTDLALPGFRRGKVRDVYDLPNEGGEERLLIIATDRISAFDVVMPTPMPEKGRLLTSLSLFWLRFIEQRVGVPTHLISDDVHRVPESAFKKGGTTRDQLVGRSMIVRKAKVVPVECVVRGYLEGSGWKEYRDTGMVCGVRLPEGLRQCDRLPEPIFTPATKEEVGKHDENITFDRACELVGMETMQWLRAKSMAVYTMAAEYALKRGIIIADTKFEFGFVQDHATEARPATRRLMLVDEALTPDSSRFWPAASYAPGRPQASFDKQFLREWLETQVASGKWDKRPPGPDIPPSIVAKTLDKYREAMERLVS